MQLKTLLLFAFFIANAYGAKVAQESKLVQKFIKNFQSHLGDHKAVFKTKGVDAETWAKVYHDETYEVGKPGSKDLDNLEQIVNLGSDSIRKNFNHLPEKSFLTAYSLVIAQDFQILNRLNASSVERLSKECADAFHQSISSNYDASKPVSKVNTLVQAYALISKKENIYTNFNLGNIGALFANALYAR